MLKSVNNFSDFGKINDLVWTGEEVKEKITWTPFHEAASSDCHEILEYFIRKDVPVDLTLDLNFPDPGFTALHYAAQRNNLQSARVLLKNAASICSMIEGICDPIHLAVFYGHVEMVTLLLDHGADVNLRFNNNFFTENKDYLGDVDFLGGKMHESLWQDHNITLLHCSILRKFDNLTQLLLDRGADVDLKTSLEKTTLMQAIEVNNDKLAEYLVKEKNANIEDRDVFGKPAIFFLMLNANRLISKYSKAEFEQEQAKFKILKILLAVSSLIVKFKYPEDDNYCHIIHYMIRYGFFIDGIQLVLYFTDFAITDIDFNIGQLCKINSEYLTPDIENDFNYLQSLQLRFEQIAFAVVDFTVSNRTIGVPYHKNIITDYEKVDWMNAVRYENDMKNIEQEINSTINGMKKMMVGNTKMNVYEILMATEAQLTKIVADNTLDISNFLENFMQKNGFMYYAYVTIYRVAVAKFRNKYFKKCTELLSSCWFRNQLPMDCCEEIVQYFDCDTIDEAEFQCILYD